MLEGVLNWLFVNFRKAVAIVLVAFAVGIVVRQYYETGEQYALIGTTLRGKWAVAVALIVITLGSALVAAITQPHLVRAFRDTKLLVSALGFICFATLFLANNEVDEWNADDRSQFMLVLTSLGTVLLIGPWVINPLIQLITAQVLDPVMNWITAHVPFLQTPLIPSVRTFSLTATLSIMPRK